MTAQQKISTLAAIQDCNRYIAKEAGRNSELRPIDVQNRLNWYYSHREKLLSMLARGGR